MNKKESIRKKEIRNIAIMIIITFIIGIAILMFYFKKEGKHYISYDENSKVDYYVFLKENEFYKEQSFDESQDAYVAALIDKIDTNFRYKLDFYENLSYRYEYKIVADIEVSDKMTRTNIYHYSEDLKAEELKKSIGLLKIDENIKIDYQKYNDIVNKFKEIYQLPNVVANLNVYLFVNVQNIEKSDTLRFMNRKVGSLSIPLSEKTVSIDVANSIVNETKKIEVEALQDYSWILMISIAYIMIGTLYIIYLIFYIRKTRTAQMIYDKEIKSILNNYDNYIQRINGSYNIGTSQVLKIESFSDMLEIRDTLKQPILMLENEAKDGSFFIIPATNSIIYTYALRVVDIKAKMDGKEIPTYDITEIPQAEFIKKKKYTDEYIKEQITMTTAMPVVDTKNIIKGSKDKEKDLYDQLEMTRSFDIKEIRKAAAEAKKKEKKTTKKETKKETKKVVKKETEKKQTTKKKQVWYQAYFFLLLM